MHITLFILYGILLSIAVVKTPFIRQSNIKPIFLLALFWLRCITAWVHNVIAYRYYPNHGDIWDYFQRGLEMKYDLLQNAAFFYQHHFQNRSGFDYISFRFMTLVNMGLDFLSFDNFYINSLLFSFPVFAGSIALYRVFVKAFSGSILCALPALLLPSALFFTACIHKDGLLYMMLGFFLFTWQKQLETRFTVKGLAVCLVYLLLILFLRAYLFAGLVPGIALWTIAQKTRLKTALNLAVVFAGCIVLMLVAGLIDPRLNVFNILSERQQEFYALTANSRIMLPVLQPTLFSFLHTLPFAVINGFFQPLPGQGGQLIYNLFTVELYGIWILLVMGFYRVIQKKAGFSKQGFGLFALAFVVIHFLLIGYIVPFVGAIVRYRSIFLPFLLAAGLFLLSKTSIHIRTEKWLKTVIQ